MRGRALLEPLFGVDVEMHESVPSRSRLVRLSSNTSQLGSCQITQTSSPKFSGLLHQRAMCPFLHTLNTLTAIKTCHGNNITSDRTGAEMTL